MGKFNKELVIKESLTIKSLKPDLNEMIFSYPIGFNFDIYSRAFC